MVKVADSREISVSAVAGSWSRFGALKSLVWCLGTAAFIAYAPAAYAQQPVDDATAPENGEIIVTAQKRSQLLSDVPISIVAATGEQLESAGVTEVAQLTKIAPGFQAATTFAGLPVFSLRGVNFNAAQISAQPAVSMYVDEAPLPYTTMYGGLLLDVERVEILKGPQGTLFGQNATGGSINFIAAKPTRDLAAGFRMDVNNFGQVSQEAYVSGPITNTLRARLAASTTQFGAWQKGYFLSTKKNGDQDKLLGRLIVDWEPSDRFKLALNLNAGYNHGEAQEPQLSSLNIVNPAAAPPGLAGHPLPRRARDAEFDPLLDPHARNSMYHGSARADYELTDNLQLTSLTSYASSRFNQITDDDGTTIPDTTVRWRGKAKSFYQEIRLTGEAFDGKLNFIIGGNYQKDKIAESELVETPGYSALPPFTNFDARYDLTNRAIAAFANADLELSSTLSLSGGVRYTETRQTMTGCTRDTGNGNAAAFLGGLSNALRGASGLPPTTAFVPGGCVTLDNIGPNPTYLPSFTDLSQTQNNLAWRGSINYKPNSDVLIYGSISRGFKSGIFPVQITIVQAGINPVSQEKLTSYEVGMKVGVLDNRLRLEGALFYYDYRDKQFLTFVPVPPIGTTSTLVNIPKSTVKGVEASFTANPIDGLTGRASLTYIKTRVGPYTSFNLLAQLVDFEGKEFNFSPPLSINADIEYKWSVGGSVSALVGAGANYNDRTYGDLGEQAFNLIPGYTIFDARVGLESDKGWRASLWMRNLTNKYYLTSVTPGNDANLKFAGMPRTFGVTFGVTF